MEARGQDFSDRFFIRFDNDYRYKCKDCDREFQKHSLARKHVCEYNIKCIECDSIEIKNAETKRISHGYCKECGMNRLDELEALTSRKRTLREQMSNSKILTIDQFSVLYQEYRSNGIRDNDNLTFPDYIELYRNGEIEIE